MTIKNFFISLPRNNKNYQVMEKELQNKVNASYEAPELQVVNFKAEQGFAASGNIRINDFGGSGLG